VDHQFYIILLLGILAYVILRYLSPVILPVIVHSDLVKEKALHFLHYRSYGIVFGLINSMFMSFFIGIGNTKVTTWTTGVMVAVNIFSFRFLYLAISVFQEWKLPGQD